MSLLSNTTLLALGAAAAVALATPADAKPRHHHHRHAKAHAVSQARTAGQFVADNNGRFIYRGAGRAAPARASIRNRRNVASSGATGGASFGSSGLVSTARSYLGTNPTGRSRLWCGAFMDLVLKRNGHAGGGLLAKAYANYGTRVSGPQVGAIAVMGRKGGGHVGVVSGVDANGNPIIISGNHNRTVAEAVYPAGRIQAYVVPN